MLNIDKIIDSIAWMVRMGFGPERMHGHLVAEFDLHSDAAANLIALHAQR